MMLSQYPELTTTLKRYWPFLLVCAVGALLYGQTLHAPFYLDDSGAIYDNKVVKDLAQAFAGLLAMRGLSTLTFALNYHWGELNVVGYHLVNIAIHLGASCLVLLLLRRIFPRRDGVALFGALLFVAHPLQTQGVTYLVQRMTSLSALFFLLAFYLFMVARTRLASGIAWGSSQHLYCYFGALLAGGLAIIAKENAVVLPVVLLLFSRLFPVSSDRRWQPLMVYVAPFFLLPVLAAIAYLLVPAVAEGKLNTMGASGLLRSMEGNSPWHYLATQGSVLWIYLRMFVLPYGQALDHGYPVTRELLTLKSIAGFSGLAGLVVLGWQLRRRYPPIAFAIGWFFITLAIESSVIPLDPLFEHRLYLPMFGFALCVVTLLDLIPRPRVQVAAAVVAILLLAALTWQRNSLWNDPIAFFESNLLISPDNERVYFNLGQEYLNAGYLDKGERLVRESIALNPSRYFGYLSLKELYVAQDRLDDAVGMLQYGLDHVSRKDQGLLYNELAFVYGKKGDFAAAIAMLQRAIEINPKIAATYYNLAQMLMFAGETQQVEEYLRKTLEFDPGHVDARTMLEGMGAGQRGREGSAQSGTGAVRGR